jgi:UDP-N-acetylmuramate dehydrogenase
MNVVDAMIADRLQKALRGTVRQNEPMARHTTWRVGGPAQLFIVPADADDLRIALEILAEADCPWHACGYGSNVLVRDGGINGAVIHTGYLRGLEIHPSGRIVAEAGVPLMVLVRRAVASGLAGVEALAGIPATIGGAVAMNAGAHGQAIGDGLKRVTICRKDGCREWPAEALEISRRHCLLPENGFILSAQLQLQPGDKNELARRMLEVLKTRRAAHYVGAANAGSVFRNPEQQAAWRLIDAAGLRGRRLGGAQVSEQHANFITNDGSATATEIETLMQEVAAAVAQHSGAQLEPEVRIWGELNMTGNV